jgi:hypothetical protein
MDGQERVSIVARRYGCRDDVNNYAPCLEQRLDPIDDVEVELGLGHTAPTGASRATEMGLFVREFIGA